MSLGITFGISRFTKKTPSETAARAGSYPLGTFRLRVAPASGASECLVPAAEQLLPLRIGHRGFEGGRLTPHLAHLVGGPDAGGYPGQIGGAEGRRLGDLGHDHGHPEDV